MLKITNRSLIQAARGRLAWNPSGRHEGFLVAHVDTKVCDYCAGVPGTTVNHNDGGGYDYWISYYRRPRGRRLWAAFRSSADFATCPDCGRFDDHNPCPEPWAEEAERVLRSALALPAE